MPKIALEQGSYQARSPIANAQVCYNLYPEPNSKDAPFPVTHYPAPGAATVSDYTGTFSGACRGIYQPSGGGIVAVFDTAVISWTGAGNSSYVHVGDLGSYSGHPVSMCDNGTTLVIVDGSPNGWTAPLATLNTGNTLAPIVDSNFYGSPRVDFIDTFLVFTQPQTRNFYTTTSNVVTPFDPLYFASKAGWNDLLSTAVVLHDNVWLLGTETTEIWYNAGAAAFPFARMPNSILQQGCIATYSPVVADNAVYWLSQDRWGRNLCMRGEGYGAKRISTYAVEDIWNDYQSVADAIGMAFQLGGHEMVGFYFPTAGAWWAYDASTQMWHQRTYNGLTQPWLPRCATGNGVANPTVAGGPNVLAGDRTGPRILQVSKTDYVDGNGAPIIRQRSWSHVQGDDGQRVAHTRFAASFTGPTLSPDTVALEWSDDAGQTYLNAVYQTVNNSSYGQYQWRRLGYARDRVYRLTWQGSGECALNGAYVDVTPHGT